MPKTSFRDLHVWRESILFVPDIYACIDTFPAHERFALTDQIRRAVISVPANIAEGQARFYRKEFLHHLCIARGSLAEVETLLFVAEQLGYLSSEKLEELEKGVQNISRPLQGLIAKLRDQIQNERVSKYRR